MMLNNNLSFKCVGDICNIRPNLSLESNVTLPFVVWIMNLTKVKAAAVVDKHNYCIGFVTYEDVIGYDPDEMHKGPDDSCVADVMMPPSMTVYQDDPIEQALIIMNLHKINWLPVIYFDTQKFSGLVCREDIEDFSSNIVVYQKDNFHKDESYKV